MRPLRRITPAIVLTGALALPLLVSSQAPSPALATEPGAEQATLAPAKPVFSQLGGRFTAPQQISLSAEPGATIHYTLNGQEPTERSTVYTGPITIDASANLTAIAVTGGLASPAAVEGYLIKTTEEPLASFAVMGDVHTSSATPENLARWRAHFDTLARILPNPDAIISNGDQINDNNYNTGADHAVVEHIFTENLARTGMRDTPLFLTFGNHDDRLAKMTEMYPQEWFPHTGGGYYEARIEGLPLLVLNTESYTTAQSTWLKERLTTLSADPALANQPIFVAGHRPTSGTVMDGMQANNPKINADLSTFPRAVYFSGHSHYNINDERSIFQNGYTAVNEGSMTYGENPSQYWANGEALAFTGHNVSSQSLVVEVYADRTEIDRINYAAENERAYTPEGQWLFQQESPFEAAGTLAGPTWTVRTAGATPEEVRAGFTYTAANRNTVDPVLAEEDPSVRETASGPVLRIPQATDDQRVHGYSVKITEAATGKVWPGIDPQKEVTADFTMMPQPAYVDVPLVVREGGSPGAAPGARLTDGTAYLAEIQPRDGVGNDGASRTIEFVAGELRPDAELAAAVTAEETRVGQTLGTITPADLGLFVIDTDRAEELLGALSDAREALAGEATQDGVEARERVIRGQLAELSALVVTVDRAALAAAVTEAEALLVGKSSARAAGPVAELHVGTERATALLNEVNVAQERLDAETVTLTGLIAEVRDATETPGTGGNGNGNGTGNGSGTGSGSSATPGEQAPERSADAAALAETGSDAPLAVAGVVAALLAAGAGLLLRVRRSGGTAER